jgi:hypothetical protein
VSDQAFIFTEDGRPIGPPVRALRDFILPLKTLPQSVVVGHACRGDFSNWLATVFHDHMLAADISKIEQRCKQGHTDRLAELLINAIELRYEFSPERFVQEDL